MFFHVRDLEVRAGWFDFEWAPGVVDLLDPKLKQVGPLAASGKVELVSESIGEIRAQGHVKVRVDSECDRCLEPAHFEVDSDFELYFRPMEGGFGEEKALDQGETEIAFYEGDGLELNDVLREFVLLSLPMQRVCREGCKGICPECGRNLNQGECGCHREKADDRWAALRELKSS